MSDQVVPHKGMSTLKKVLIGATVAVLLFLGGCAALVVGFAAGEVDTPEPGITAPGFSAPPKAARAPVEEDDAMKNVTIDFCRTDQFDFVTVGYSIDNPTSKSSTYFLDFDAVDSAGVKVGSVTGIETNVVPGRVSKGEAIGTLSSSTQGKVQCSIAEATRTAD